MKTTMHDRIVEGLEPTTRRLEGWATLEASMRHADEVYFDTLFTMVDAVLEGSEDILKRARTVQG